MSNNLLPHQLNGRRVLVTGAGGFIGGHLATRLVEDGAEVRAFVRYNSRNDRGTLEWHDRALVEQMDVVLGDLRDPESVRRAVEGVDWVMHVGAQIAIPYSYVNPRDFFETNVGGTLNVAQAALDLDVSRMVHVSTSEVYGTALTVPITEEHPIQPQSPYSASKIGADALVESFHRSFGLPSVTVRPFNTYGPHQSARAIIPTIISQALAGERLRLGSLDPQRDLTFVDDTVAGFVAAASSEAAVGTAVQLGTGHAVSVGDLVELIGDALGRDLEVELDPSRVRPAKSEVQLLLSSPEKMRQLTGWTAQVSLKDGLGRTIEWVRHNAHRFRTEYVI